MLAVSEACRAKRWDGRNRVGCALLTRTSLALFAALVCLASSPIARAADLSVQATISAKRPYLGDTVVLQIAVEQSVEKPPEIDTTGLESLGAKQLGEPAFGHQRTIINGVSSEKFTYQFRIQFTPNKVGPLKIPAVTVRQGKQTAATAPIEIEVVGPEAQDTAIVELVASDRSVYPGQNLTLTVALLLRRLVHQGELLEADPFSGREQPQVKIPWIEGTEVMKPASSLGVPPRFLKGSLEQRAREDGPSFLVNDLFVRSSISLFEPRTTQTGVRFDRAEVERTGMDGEKDAYYRYSLPLEYRAAHAGSVGPLTVQLRGPVFTGVRRGPRGLEAESREIFAVSQPVSINILSVPKVGQSDTFTGGVGVFKLTATAQPTKVRIGDPITLTVRVTGSGNLEELGPPNLMAQERWTRDFKVHDDPSPGRLEENAKVFTFSVRPKSAETTELPAVRFSYFNPKLKKYEDTFTDRIPLEVSETARLDPSEIVDSAPDANTSRELAEVAGGLAANYTGPDVLDAHGPYHFAPATLATIVLAPPAVWVAAFLLHRRAIYRRRNPAWLRAQAAYRCAKDRIEAIARLPIESRTEEVARALAGYLADRLNLPAGELTPAEARQHLLDLGAGTELATEFANLVERCDRARFGRSEAGGDGSDLLDSALTLLGRVERVASDGSRHGALATAARSLVLLAVMPNQDITRIVTGDPLDRHAVLARANAAFERGARAGDAAAAQQAFREAIAAYDELASDGVQNGKLYYNLANAHFRVGDVPRAILNYRLAERLIPRDGQVAANLAFARSRVADRVEPSETSRLLRQLLFLHYSWSVRERTQVSVALFLVTWLLFAVHIWLPRRWLTVAGLLCLIGSASLAYSVVVQIDDEARHPIGVLVSSDVVVRSGDGETYEPQFNRPLAAGIEFRLLDQRGDWIQLEIPDGKTGWVKVTETEIAHRS